MEQKYRLAWVTFNGCIATQANQFYAFNGHKIVWAPRTHC
jgi:hypothetical protein